MTTQHEETDPQQGAWLVYLNGIQVPCPSVTVSYGVWKIPEATLSFPPHRLLQRLGAEDRLEVVVFYLDTTFDPDHPRFRLLFEGEIMGWSYTSSPMGRSMTFNAIADISIFQSLYFFFMNTVDAVIGYTAEPGKSAATVSAAGIHYPFSIFKSGLFLEAGQAQADIERPFDLLSNVVRGLLSTPPKSADGDDTEDHRPIPCVNFYMRWARKRNFVNRFIALPSFEDDLALDANGNRVKGTFAILQAVKAQHALTAMATSLSKSVGDQGNIYDLLQRLLGMTYSELAMIPTAPCVRARFSDGTVLGLSTLPLSQPDRAGQEPLRLVNYFVKPQMLFGIPPACNLIFPGMISSYTFSENYWTQPTRAYINDQFYAQGITNTALTAAALTVGYPEEIDEVLRARKGDGESAQNMRLSGKNVLVFPEEFFKGPVVTRMAVPAWFTYLATTAAEENKAPADPNSIPPSDPNLHSLFFLYSQHEYFRSRYEQRGGAVDMIWNPYILPGFPCYVFDHRGAPLDTAGYVLNVQQTMNASSGGQMVTSINYSFGRTINELLDTMKTDMARLGVVLGSAPVEPVDGIRRISQNFEQAEGFYNSLLFGRTQLVAKKASADLRDIVAFVTNRDDENYGDDVKLEPLNIVGDDTSLDDIAFIGSTTGKRLPPYTNFGATSTLSTAAVGASRDIEPTEGFKQLFNNGPKALHYIARPICTLEEYISFIHGSTPLAKLITDGQVSGPRHEFSYEELDGSSSAIYYERIRKLRPGPGTRPSDSQTGVSLTPPVERTDGSTTGKAIPHTGAMESLPDDFPQTRLNWDEILLAYRQQIIDRQSPQG